MARAPAYNFGKSLSCNGTSDFFTSSIAPAISGFSIAFWLYLVALADGGRVVDWQDSGPAKGFRAVQTINQTTGISNLDFVVQGVGTVSYPNLRAGVWRHVILAYAPNTVQLYINASLVGSAGNGSMQIPSQTLTFFRRSNAAGSWSKGYIDELLFVPTPLSQNEVANIYSLNLPPSNTLAHYDFNGTFADRTGNGTTLVATGTTFTTLTPSTVRQTATARVATSQREVA